MHELSICNAIHRIVEKALAEQGAGKRVKTIYLDLGQMRQVVPPTLEYCWGIVTETSPLAGSRLEINHIPIRLQCREADCGHLTVVEGFPILTCGKCHSGNVEMLSGEEFLLTSLDVE